MNRDPLPATKAPATSAMTSVDAVAWIVTVPPEPTGTVARFATV